VCARAVFIHLVGEAPSGSCSLSVYCSPRVFYRLRVVFLQIWVVVDPSTSNLFRGWPDCILSRLGGWDLDCRPTPVRSLREIRVSNIITRGRIFTRGLPISILYRFHLLCLLPYPGLLARPPVAFPHPAWFRGALGVSRHYKGSRLVQTNGW